MMAVNLINPLTYLAFQGSHVHLGVSTPGASLLPPDLWARAAIAWAIGAAGCAVAVVGWKRLEV